MTATPAALDALRAALGMSDAQIAAVHAVDQAAARERRRAMYERTHEAIAGREIEVGNAAQSMRDRRACLERVLAGTADDQDRALVAEAWATMCDLFA